MKLDAKRVWVCGAYGRVGRAVLQLLKCTEMELLKTDLDDVDVTRPEDVKLFAGMHRPELIINCTGMTDVRQCEANREEAFKVNALGPRNLSIAARKLDARIVHISTDDVFDGNSTTPYSEFDLPNPQTVYGKSKLAGENFVRELCPRHIVIRSSWIYCEGENFVTDILAKAQSQARIEVPNNQFAAPTSSAEFAKAIIRILEDGQDGVFHAVCSGFCSRYEFAQEIIRLAGLDVEIVPTMQAEDVSMRPSFSVLDNMMLRISGIGEPPHWKEALQEFLQAQGYSHN